MNGSGWFIDMVLDAACQRGTTYWTHWWITVNKTHYATFIANKGSSA